MKKLSDYKGDDAILLWADLLEPITAIISDKKVAVAVRSGKNKILIAKEIILVVTISEVWREGKLDEGSQKVQTSSYKINQY